KGGQGGYPPLSKGGQGGYPPLSKGGRGGYSPLSKGGRGGYSPSLRVVITMRADFVGQCAEYPQLAQLIETQNKIVGRMQEAELREAIAKPAEKEGWTIPEDLQNEIVKDVQQSPGSLPLLQYLLYELWDWRDRRLTVKTYQDMGGVLGTLQTQADKVYNSLDPEEKTVAKSIFLELTQLVEEDKPTSRQVRKTRLTDLPPSPEKVETVLGKLEDARLIVTSELQARGNNGDTIKVVDVAHEALIRNWNTLKDWLNDNREIKRQRDELKDKAQEWEEKGKRREGLLRGIDLSDAEAFVRRYGETGIAREYVQKSIRNRRITNILSIGTVATMLTVVTGLWLNAQRQATIANLRANAAQAQQLLTTPQPLGGVVLAIQATGESQDQLGRVMSSVQSSLLTGIQTLREHNRFQGHQDSVYAVAFSPDGETIVSGSGDGTLRLWTRQGEPIGEPLRGHQNRVWAVAFSPDGETIVSGSWDGTLRLW
ncbi:WD40 repeat domain-containing protein, partial [Phormidium sp. CCY1219]|uniref:WD40 repeat domain-containing protein n=1 Tax=Phormidium sp. CCY1219 TaxID=2886104 RepID=UPI003FA77112